MLRNINDLLWIGLTGRKGVGKTYTANELQTQIDNVVTYSLSSYIDYYIRLAYTYVPESSYADHARRLYTVRPQHAAEKYKDFDKGRDSILFRKFKQDVGAVLRSETPRVFTTSADDYIARMFEEYKETIRVVIVPDLRFPADIDWIRSKPHNLLVSIESVDSAPRADWHASENKLTTHKHDYTYINLRHSGDDAHKQNMTALVALVNQQLELIKPHGI